MEISSHEYQTSIYRQMTPQQKYEVMMSLIDSARAMKEAYVRSVQSEWSNEQVQQAVREWILYARQ